MWRKLENYLECQQEDETVNDDKQATEINAP